MNLGLVNSLKKIETIGPRLDYMEIVIDSLHYMMFGDYTAAIKFIGCSVLYDTAVDMFQGKRIERVVDVTAERVISTVKANDEQIKLLPDQGDVNPVCNFEIATLGMGQKQTAVICYLSSYVENCSDKARWYDLTVVDIKSRSYTLRYFSSFTRASSETKDILDNLVGCYIRTNMIRTMYGYQVDKGQEIELFPANIVVKPEVEIAIKIIDKATSGDDELRKYMNTYNYVGKMKTLIDIEPGYYLVHLAMELMLINSVDNLTDTFSKRTLIRAAITSRGYLIDRKNNLSKPILNINKVQRSELKEDLELINVLDAVSENTNTTKRMYIWISNFANYIIKERRGRIDEEKIANDIHDISNMFGGLL